MPWDDDLTPDQRTAAGHEGSDARLLAGPGTGKTLILTRRIVFLVEAARVDPERILALTFTRAAARELRQRVDAELDADTPRPRISTLHSFALRQLLRNSGLVPALPDPLRIADDWEERNVVLEDIKSMLDLGRIDDARDLLNQLSADWQTLTADEDEWERRFPNPTFLGAWTEHRGLYGYVLRSELVYQLKRALEQHADLDLEGPPAFVLVDEYQDLNRCDLAVVKALEEREAEVYGAGDDDQSIYGFRKAHPEGIRRFPEDYVGSADLDLEICKRCDENILSLGLFVARQDYERIEKPIRHDDGREGGNVAILRFSDQVDEALGVSQICRYLINTEGIPPERILVLLRSDRNRVFSSPLRDAMDAEGVPVVAATPSGGVLDDDDGRAVLALLRLCVNRRDSLAWRTLLQIRANQVGPVAIQALYDLARADGLTFAGAVERVGEDADLIPAPHGNRVRTESVNVNEVLDERCPPEGEESVADIVHALAEEVVDDPARLEEIYAALGELEDADSMADFLRERETASEGIEQDLEEGSVNVLTMHQAKGLTADAVIIVAAEDEYIPGRAEGEALGDERRLLYVSLTRARHHLFVTYCERRHGPQRFTGRTSGQTTRSLTRFLRDAPPAVQSGEAFTDEL